MSLLMPFFSGGLPDARTFPRLLLAAQDAGADLLEVGLPFTDPVADGPVIQAASHRALSRGVTPSSVLSALEALRPRLRIPVVALTYLNPLLAGGGLERRARALARAGVSAVVVPDLPPEAGAGVSRALARRGVDLAYCLSVEAPPERIRRVARASRGFVYLVAAAGTTGVRARLDPRLGAVARRIREATGLPRLAGFGIGTPALAARAARHAEGVIVGSALVSEVLAGGPGVVRRVERRIRDFRRALDRGREGS